MSQVNNVFSKKSIQIKMNLILLCLQQDFNNLVNSMNSKLELFMGMLINTIFIKLNLEYRFIYMCIFIEQLVYKS